MLYYVFVLQGVYQAAAAWSSTAEQGACGPDCRGECFAGACLFQVDGLESNAGGAAEGAYDGLGEEGEKRTPPSATAPAVGVDVSPILLPPIGLTNFSASPSSSYDADNKGFPAASESSWATVAWPSDGGAGTEARAGALIPLLQRGRVFDHKGASLGRGMIAHDIPGAPGAMPLELQDASISALQSELAAARSTDASISAQNRILQRELSAWRKAGSIVARHEANLVSFIRHARATGGTDALPAEASPSSAARDGADVAAGDADALALLTDSVMTNVFNAGKKPLDDTSNSHRLILIFFVVNTLAFLTFTVSQNAKKVFAPQRKRPAASKLEQLMSRRPAPIPISIDGPGAYMIEISDIQVSNLLVAGEICVAMKIVPGNLQELRTKALESCAHPLSFSGTFNFSIPRERTECKCLISVIDTETKPEEMVAHGELSTDAIFRFACSEYVTVDLTRPGRGSPDWAEIPGEQRRRPHVSMRICRAGGPKGAEAVL
jgi:hypothetical protein